MKRIILLLITLLPFFAAGETANRVLLPNPDYCLQEETQGDFKTNSPLYVRTADNTRLIREYCNDSGKRTGVLIGPLGKWADEDYYSAYAFIPSTTERPAAIEKLMPGTPIDSAFERLKVMKQAMRAFADRTGGSATVVFLGAPMEMAFKAGTSGSISSLTVKFIRKDPEGDRIIIESLIGYLGKTAEDPYVKETGDDVLGSLGGMQNTYRKYGCSWEKPGFKAVFTGNYTHSNSFSTEGKTTEGFYFEGELKVEAVILLSPTHVITPE